MLKWSIRNWNNLLKDLQASKRRWSTYMCAMPTKILHFCKQPDSGIQEYSTSSIICFFLVFSITWYWENQGKVIFCCCVHIFSFSLPSEPQDPRHFGVSGVSWRTLKITVAAMCRKSGPFSTLLVPPKLLLISSKQTLAKTLKATHSTVDRLIPQRLSDHLTKDNTHSSEDAHIAVYFIQCKMTHQTLSSIAQRPAGNEDNEHQ